MHIAIFGLGYVGCVSAACFVQAGHDVTGVDVNPAKLELIRSGHSPIIEDQVEELIRDAVAGGRLRTTASPCEAVREADVSLVCVGTPSQANGDLDLRHIKAVSQQIGQALAGKAEYHVVAVRSTVLPGTIETCVIPILEEASGKRVGVDLGVCSNPEFLREGSAVQDFYQPPFTLVGEWDARSGDVVEGIYQTVRAPTVRTDIRTAEMVKYVGNAFHALKICFANEVGNLCKRMNIDSHQVMDIFCMDTKLNISRAYLRPGYAFGGSCLPKDLRALLYKAKAEDVDAPVLEAIPRSNEQQIRVALSMVLASGKKRVGLIGLSFKPRTDDLRESALVRLAETLLGKGYELRIYDENVSLAKMVGANKHYIENAIPHISSLLCSSLEEVVEDSEVLVIGHQTPALVEAIGLNLDGRDIIDLVRISESTEELGDAYQGICW